MTIFKIKKQKSQYVLYNPTLKINFSSTTINGSDINVNTQKLKWYLLNSWHVFFFYL